MQYVSYTHEDNKVGCIVFALSKKDKHLFWTNVSFTVQLINVIHHINDARIKRDEYVIFQMLPFDSNVWSLVLVLRAESSCVRF